MECIFQSVPVILGSIAECVINRCKITVYGYAVPWIMGVEIVFIIISISVFADILCPVVCCIKDKEVGLTGGIGWICRWITVGHQCHPVHSRGQANLSGGSTAHEIHGSLTGSLHPVPPGFSLVHEHILSPVETEDHIDGVVAEEFIAIADEPDGHIEIVPRCDPDIRDLGLHPEVGVVSPGDEGGELGLVMPHRGDGAASAAEGIEILVAS